MDVQQEKLDFSLGAQNDKSKDSKYKKDFPTEEDSMFRNKKALNSSKKKKHFKNKNKR